MICMRKVVLLLVVVRVYTQSCQCACMYVSARVVDFACFTGLGCFNVAVGVIIFLGWGLR